MSPTHTGLLAGACPVCGSEDVHHGEETYTAHRPYGGPISMPIAVDRCRVCKTDGDFHGGNDTIYTSANYLARLSATRPMIDAINENGVDDMTFERVFGVEFGTLKKWREGGCSPVEFALLFIVAGNPKIVAVLDEGCWWRRQ